MNDANLETVHTDCGDRIFLCHASEDGSQVEMIYQGLKSASLNPWIDRNDIPPARNWDVEIRKTLAAARLVLIFLSKHLSSKNGYVQREIEIALDIWRQMPPETNHSLQRNGSKALLLGLITDDRGNRMGPSFTTKGSRKYRYYVSTPLVQAQGHKAGSVARVPADEVDMLVVSAMREKLPHAAELGDTELVRTFVQARRLIIKLKDQGASETDDAPAPIDKSVDGKELHVVWQKPPSKRKREILLPASAAKDPKPIRAETRASLVSAIAKARHWLDDLVTGRIKDLNEIATAEGCSLRKVEMTLSLAFLAPNLVKAAIEGQLPHGLGMVRLYEPPAEWSTQYVKLGLRHT